MNKFLFPLIFFLFSNLNSSVESQMSGARGCLLFEIINNYLLGCSLKAEMETDKINYCKLKRIDIVEWFYSIGPAFGYKISNSFIHNFFMYIDCEFGCKSFHQKRYPTSWYFHSIKVAFNFLIELFQLPIFSVNFNFGRATDSENYKEQNAFYYSVSGSIVGFSNIKGRIHGGISLFFGVNFASNIDSKKVKELREKIWNDYKNSEPSKAKIIFDYVKMFLTNTISDLNLNYLKGKINSINLTAEAKYLINYIEIIEPVKLDNEKIKDSFNKFNESVKNINKEYLNQFFGKFYTFKKYKNLKIYLDRNNILLNSIIYLRFISNYNFKNQEGVYLDNFVDKIEKNSFNYLLNSNENNFSIVSKNCNLLDALLVVSILCKVLNEEFVYENLHSFSKILSSKEKKKLEELSKDELTEYHISILSEISIKVIEDIKFKKIQGYCELVEFLESFDFYCK